MPSLGQKKIRKHLRTSKTGKKHVVRTHFKRRAGGRKKKVLAIPVKKATNGGTTPTI